MGTWDHPPFRDLYYLLSFMFFNVYFWKREKKRQRVSRGGAEREGDTESQAGSRLWAIITESNAGLKITNREIMTWAKVRRPTDWATQAPLYILLYRISQPLGAEAWLTLSFPSPSDEHSAIIGFMWGPDSSLSSLLADAAALKRPKL